MYFLLEMELGLFVLHCLYFFLPAYIANMMPVFVKKIPLFDFPIWESKLGSHKTWRGLFFGTLGSGLVFWVQQVLYKHGFQSLALIDYSDFTVLFGFLLGLGALLGDLVKSYYKRKADIAPGQPWIPFDQIDFVIGALVVGFLVYVPPIEVVLVLLVVSPVLHLLVNYIGYLLGINKKKW